MLGVTGFKQVAGQGVAEVVGFESFIFARTSVFVGPAKWVWRVTRTAVDTTMAAFFALALAFEGVHPIVFTLTGLITAFSSRIEILGVFTHVFTELVELFRGELVELLGVDFLELIEELLVWFHATLLHVLECLVELVEQVLFLGGIHLAALVL